MTQVNSLYDAVIELQKIDDANEGAIVANAFNLYLRALHLRGRGHFRGEDVRNIFRIIAHLILPDEPVPDFLINGGPPKSPQLAPEVPNGRP